ncbi:hypothetical protein [Pandoraea oxalativorans]|uniref:Uncharacterized protein n=1 Tax=Pandoraea oxalativorans TaxID=573737 RepID=A0A0E3YDD8_9BURK|nr:hypothetical protein [Pandoraea oxalativorans]AKC70520.1 hypothetical protein MB84_15035 [Pandoraea oxalativorans]
MKLLRLVLVLLLCAVLPLSGLAASGMAGACPMQMTAASDEATVMITAVVTTAAPANVAVSPPTEMAMDHCDGMSMPAEGKPGGPFCKVTAQCNLGSLYHPTLTPDVARPVSITRKTGFHYANALRLRAPDGLWRPPTSL